MITIPITRETLKRLEKALDEAEKYNQKVKIVINYNTNDIGIAKGRF